MRTSTGAAMKGRERLEGDRASDTRLTASYTPC